MKRDLSLPKNNNIKKIRLSCFVCILVLLSSSATFALDPIGSTITNLQPRQFQLGFEYCHSSMDFKLIDGKFMDFVDGSLNDSGKSIDLALKEFEKTNSFVNFGYSIERNWEVFLRIGTTKAKFGDSLLREGEKFESDSTPALGGGIKATLYDGRNFKIGGLIQANWAHYNGQLNSPQRPLPQFVETDIKEIQIALGANYMLIDGLWIYGGPLVHFLKGEFDNTLIQEAKTGTFQLIDSSWDIEQDSMYGGYLGTQLEIGKNCHINIEYQFTGGADAYGAGIVLGF